MLNHKVHNNRCSLHQIHREGLQQTQHQRHIGHVIDDDGLSFNARFGGVPIDLYVPMVAILAIYAKENGQGMVFGNEAGAPDPDQPPKPKKPDAKADKPAKARPVFKVVK